LADAVITDDLPVSVDWWCSSRPATFSKMYCGIKPVLSFVEGAARLFWVFCPGLSPSKMPKKK
jgi:hypothetical protein